MKVYDYCSTICSTCLKIVGNHWSWSRWDSYPSDEDESGKEGISVSDKQPCPHCGGCKLVGCTGRYEIGSTANDKLATEKCKKCGIVTTLTDLQTDDVRHEDSQGKNGLCGDCYTAFWLRRHPDPSNEVKRYKFDRYKREWVLEKQRVTCPKCRRVRWLIPANAWKTLCEKCYSENQNR